MEGLKDILIFCVGSGIITLCIILIVSGILRWITPSDTRAKRLNILAWIVAAMLSAASLLYFTWDSSGNDNTKISAFLNMFSKLFMVLAVGVITASAVVLLVIIVIYLYHILRVITHTETRTDIQDSRLDGFIQILRSPAVVSALALGIMALFLILPLLAGKSEAKTDGLIDIWENGVSKIGHIFEEDRTQLSPDASDAFITYTLIYIIVLGVGLAVVKILHSIIIRSLKKRAPEELIDEYSTPIGLLAVGVAVLWSIKKGEISWNSELEVVSELTKSFIVVAFIATLVILVLEVIRLLMDMKEPFIRQEARYLFITLVGECTIVIMNLVLTFCGALSNAMGGKGDTAFIEFEEKVREKMKKLMDDQLDTKDQSPSHEQPDNSNDHERIFMAFDQKTTKK